MRFVQIPNIDKTWGKVEIKTLSPSSFSWICNGCAYQVLLQKVLSKMGNKSCLLPAHKNTILGTIIHKIYELTSKRLITTPKEMMGIWETLVEKQVKMLTETYPTLRNPKINDYDKRNKTIRYAISLLQKDNNYLETASSNIKVNLEMRLSCEDIGLYGIADKVIIDSGNVDIVDYKSGHIKDLSGNIKQEYIIQLHLYATMCEHLVVGNIRSLKLIDIDGTTHIVEYNSELSNRLLNEVEDKIYVLNNAISTLNFQNLVKPEKDRCSNCSCRHVCNYMIQYDDAVYKTIFGYVERIHSANMYVLVYENVRYYISGIDFYKITAPEYYINKKLVFLNVIRSSQMSNDYTYKITENTIVYELL